MKYGIVSDVHGNLPALQSALHMCAEMKVDEIFFLGDAVGYGASPNQCITLIRREASAFIAGNHDFGAVGKTNIDTFNSYAREALYWTERILTKDNCHYLGKRSLTMERDDMLLVHASPYEPHQWHYIFKPQEAMRNFFAFKHHICFIGHSHLPCVISMSKDGRLSLERITSLTLQDDTRYIINVGSIGQPRDGDPRASFGILDTVNREYTLNRVHYDIKEAQMRILSMGLPRFLAERLAIGR